MSLLDLTATRALIASDLSDDAFQAVIDQEEAWLARRIGPLTGIRTEIFRGVRARQVIRLQRPTENVDDAYASAFLVEDRGIDVTANVILLRNGWRVGLLIPLLLERVIPCQRRGRHHLRTDRTCSRSNVGW